MIDYGKIVSALNHYRSHGYTQIEIPWCVTPEVNLVTFPDWLDRKEISCHWGDLIGSAEQGFVQKMVDGLMPDGRSMAVSPCFRMEASYNELTRPWFMKLELIDFLPTDPTAARNRMITDAFSFFSQCGVRPTVIDTCQVPRKGVGNEFDIVAVDGTELGSYGIRKHGNFLWVYGTGIAEPRLSVVQERWSRI